MSLLTNLVSYWKLDEASGSRADSVGSNTLTDNNTVTGASGKITTCSHFTAANSEYLTVADNSGLSPSTAFTFSCWVKPVAGSTYNLFDKASTFICRINIAQQGDVVFYVYSSSIRYGYTTGPLFATGDWVFLTYVFDGSLTGNDARLKIYVNASPKTLNFDGTTIPSSIDDTTNDLKIGGTLFYLNGDMCEVGYWNRALTQDEITDLYNVGDGLAYPFDSTQRHIGNGRMIGI